MRRAWALNELEEERGSEGGREERERERVNVCIYDYHLPCVTVLLEGVWLASHVVGVV